MQSMFMFTDPPRPLIISPFPLAGCHQTIEAGGHVITSSACSEMVPSVSVQGTVLLNHIHMSLSETYDRFQFQSPRSSKLIALVNHNFSNAVFPSAIFFTFLYITAIVSLTYPYAEYTGLKNTEHRLILGLMKTIQ